MQNLSALKLDKPWRCFLRKKDEVSFIHSVKNLPSYQVVFCMSILNKHLSYVKLASSVNYKFDKITELSIMFLNSPMFRNPLVKVVDAWFKNVIEQGCIQVAFDTAVWTSKFKRKNISGQIYFNILSVTLPFLLDTKKIKNLDVNISSGTHEFSQGLFIMARCFLKSFHGKKKLTLLIIC